MDTEGLEVGEGAMKSSQIALTSSELVGKGETADTTDRMPSGRACLTPRGPLKGHNRRLPCESNTALWESVFHPLLKAVSQPSRIQSKNQRTGLFNTL